MSQGYRRQFGMCEHRFPSENADVSERELHPDEFNWQVVTDHHSFALCEH
jgi:hypothetical protein